MPRNSIRAPTLDREPPERIAIHTVEQIGPNMSVLPNGNLLCANVPIARVGWMVYGPGETPITVGDQGVAYVERTAETLFSAICIGSFMGAAVTDEHPSEDVTPDNWKKLGRGFATTNVRQGTGDDAEVLLADLIITDKALIREIQSGKREVSCGYDADYTQTAAGVGTQTNIVGNHIALVEKGRCGPRCAIGDQAFNPKPKKETTMNQRVKIIPGQRRRAVLDSLRKKVRDAEEALNNAQGYAEGQEPLEDDLDDGDDGDGHTHIHIHTGSGKGAETDDDGELPADPAATVAPAGGDTESRFAAIEQAIKTLAEAVGKLSGAAPAAPATDADQMDDGEGDEPGTEVKDEFPEELKEENKTGTNDSAALETSYKHVLAQAEVLVPGFRMPTFDAKAKRKITVDSMCQARRRALDACYATGSGATLINGVAGAKTVDMASMTCAAVATLFRAASGAKALMNNAAATKDSQKTPEAPQGYKQPTLADINAANAAYWKGKQKQ